MRQGRAQLGREHDEQRDRAVLEDEAEQVGDHLQLEDPRRRVDREQHPHAAHDLQRPGPVKESENAVECVRDDEHFHDVAPSGVQHAEL